MTIFRCLFFFLILTSSCYTDSRLRFYSSISPINKEKSLELYNQSIAYKEQGLYKEALSQALKSIKLNPNLISAYQLCAEIYQIQGKNRLACQMYQNALYRDNKNAQIYFELGLLYFKMDSYFSATDCFKRAIKIKPNYAEAYYYLGLIAEKEGLWFINNDDFLKASKNYKSAIFYKQDYFLALLHLGMVYYELGIWDSSLYYLDRAKMVDSTNAYLYFYKGFSLQKLLRYKEAENAYIKGISLLPEDERYVFDDISLIASSTELNLYEKILPDLRPDEKKKFLDIFWKRRDPTLATEINERKIEHYRRVAYSITHFSNERFGIPGWKTDRGKLYIRYGEPAERKHTLLDFPTELWTYSFDGNDIAFTFDDRFLNSKLSFSNVDDSKYRYDVLSRVVPSLYFRDDYEDIFHYIDITQFRGLGRNTIVCISLEVPIVNNPSTPVPRPPSLNDTFTTHIVVFDKNWNEIKRITKPLYLFSFDDTTNMMVGRGDSMMVRSSDSMMVRSRGDSMNRPYTVRVGDYSSLEQDRKYIGFCDFELKYGDYLLGVDIINGKRTGSTTSTISLRQFSNNELDMSSLLLGYKTMMVGSSTSNHHTTQVRIGDNPLSEPVNPPLIKGDKGGIQVGDYLISELTDFIPSSSHIYNRSLPIELYYQIYNLTKNANGETNYQVEYKIAPYIDDSKMFIANRIINKGIRKMKHSVGIHDYFSTSSVVVRRGYNANVNEKLTIETNNFISGDYQLELLITDLVKSVQVSNKVVFKIK